MSKAKSKHGAKDVPPGVRLYAMKRMQMGTNVSALAVELGVHRTTLYQWMEAFQATSRENRPAVEEIDPAQYKIRRLEQQVAELEGVIGRQKLELDFFQSALRRAGGLRQNPSAGGGKRSTPRSAAGRSAGKAN